MSVILNTPCIVLFLNKPIIKDKVTKMPQKQPLKPIKINFRNVPMNTEIKKQVDRCLSLKKERRKDSLQQSQPHIGKAFNFKLFVANNLTYMSHKFRSKEDLV